MGVVANKYIELNKHWAEPKYLNLMNNLLCGVPMTFMRKIPENIYLQLSHQVYFAINTTTTFIIILFCKIIFRCCRFSIIFEPVIPYNVDFITL